MKCFLNIKPAKMLFFAGIILSVQLLWSKQTFAEITRYTMEGSLEPTHDLDCISSNEVKNVYTPADLYPASRKCVEEGRYEDYIELFMIAGAFAVYDEHRVVDYSAHQARQVLILENFSDFEDPTKHEMQKLISAFIEDEKKLSSLCKTARKIGPPEYYPSYMILHGIKAYTGDPHKEALVDSFDSEEAWNETLDKYLHCK